MIRINIVFPWEKRRIIKEISSEVEKKYKQKVKVAIWNYNGDKIACLYIFLEDKTLYIRFDLDTNKIVTMCEDLSI